MIFRLRDLIPSEGMSTKIATGQWVRAMHLPFYDGLFEKIRTAWAYIRRDDLVVVQWPKHGEFEQVMARKDAA